MRINAGVVAMVTSDLVMQKSRPLRNCQVSVDHLQIIFKIAERCNINCDYCYYFNMGDNSALQRPPRVSVDVAADIAAWLAQGCRDLQVQRLSISFHGGEPMLLSPDNFDAICSEFTARLSQVVDFKFNIQTNGTIMSDKWLSILCKHSVHVGVSIDGDRIAHDRHRLDRRGKSTFEKTENNLRLLVKRAEESDVQIGPATISVLDCRNDYEKVYKYLRGLGLRRMSFLLPDRSFDDTFAGAEESAQRYGESLFQIFKAWMTEDDPSVYVRFVDETMQHFQLLKDGTSGSSYNLLENGTGGGTQWATQIIVVHSDGVVGINDSLTPALAWYMRAPGCSFRHTSLRAFLMNDIFLKIDDAKRSLSAKCQACRWKRICGGGDLENRYSQKSGFDNPSAYCEGYQHFFQGVCDVLVENGYPVQNIKTLMAL